MSITVLACWLLLLIPGYSIARRFDPDGVKSGLLSAIALSFIAAMTALSAIMIPAYFIGIPLVVLSAGAAAFVLWGIYDLFQSREWPTLGNLLLAAIGIEIILVIADMALGARLGSILGADAVVHVARIRHLLGQGLVNVDPFIGEYFYPLYHTNLLHGLMASVAQVTGEDPLTVWFSSLSFAKLLIVSGAWYAGWAIFRSSIAGWVTAIFMLGARAPVIFVLYPNQLAPWFLLPVLVGFVIRTARDGASRPLLIGIAATSLMIGGTHGMYAVFAVMAIGPILGIWTIIQWLKKSADRRLLVACCIAMGIGLPFPAITHFARGMKTATAASTNPAQADDATPKQAEGKGNRKNQSAKLSPLFKKLDDGQIVHKFGRGFTSNRGLRVIILALAALLAVLAGRGREAGMVMGMILIVAIWLHVPPLCTLLFKVGGADWLILRLGSLQDVFFALLIPGSLAAITEVAARAQGKFDSFTMVAFRSVLAVVCLFMGAYFAAQRAPYNWKSYLTRSSNPISIRHGSQLNPLRRFAQDLREHVPANTVVLADPSIGMKVVMAHDCRVVTSTSSSVGVTDIGQRTSNARRMLKNMTEAEVRDPLLEQYGVTHVVVDRPAPKWLYDRMDEFWLTEFGLAIISLRPPGAPDHGVLGDYEQALLDSGRFMEAIGILEKKAANKPDSFRHRFRLARALLRVGRNTEAIESFELALGIRPDDARPAIMIGNTYSEMGWYDSAIKAYADTAEIAARTGDDRALGSAYFNMGNMYFRVGSWDEAIAAYEQALEANPRHADAENWIREARLAAAGLRSPDADDDMLMCDEPEEIEALEAVPTDEPVEPEAPPADQDDQDQP
ncbi:MAG: tetratricopeptide repeat protein [Phycisphaerales bacterium]|nr:tetratricopeptide repeat protein [Phycisphaerales bacterium]